MKRRKKASIIIFCVLSACLAGVVLYTGLVIGEIIKFTDEINGLIISTLTLVGTVFLGVITVWQTGKANELSELAFKDRVNCDLIPTKNVIVSRDSFNTETVIDFAKKHETEGLYCEIEGKKYSYGENDTYLKLRLAFKTSGSFLENCTVENIYLNKSFDKEKGQLHRYYVKFKIRNPKQRLILSYNPVDELYYLKIYMREDPLLQEINDKGYFVVDLELKLTSVFSTTRNITYSINFEKINNLQEILRNGTLETHKLTNIIVHRSDLY